MKPREAQAPPELEQDSAGARWRWLLRTLLVLIVMIVVPGLLYDLAAPGRDSTVLQLARTVGEALGIF